MFYRHTQVGLIILALLFLVILMLFLINKTGNCNLCVWITVTGLLILAVLFGSLTVEISESQISCRFGIGLIHKELNLDDVKNADIVTNPWYYGWGIRLTPSGWMYNVSGLQAVELALKSGKNFRIGTDQPEELLAAIHTAIDERNRSLSVNTKIMHPRQ